jgi:hypothetical protein
MGAHRRNLVIWRQSAGSMQWRDAPRRARPRRLRIVFLLTVAALWPVVRAVRARWRPLLAGTALTTVGIVLRGSLTSSIVLLPGLILLLTAPLLPGSPEADRLRRSELERELAGYSTTAQRYDLQATLDQYPDEVTREVREILAGQAAASGNSRIPGTGRYWCRGF